MEYYKIMRDLREDADLTQQQVAEILGTSQTMYARYERGANELPLHHLLTLCGLYRVSADYILGIEKNPPIHGNELNPEYRNLLYRFEMLLLSEQKRKKRE